MNRADLFASIGHVEAQGAVRNGFAWEDQSASAPQQIATTAGQYATQPAGNGHYGLPAASGQGHGTQNGNHPQPQYMHSGMARGHAPQLAVFMQQLPPQGAGLQAYHQQSHSFPQTGHYIHPQQYANNQRLD